MVGNFVVDGKKIVNCRQRSCRPYIYSRAKVVVGVGGSGKIQKVSRGVFVGPAGS